MLAKAIFNKHNGVLEILCSECGKVVLKEEDFDTVTKYGAMGMTSLSPMYCDEHSYMYLHGGKKSREMRKKGIKEKLREGIKEKIREGIVKKNVLNIEISRPNQELIIMRGIPGSGKSTEGKKIVGKGITHSTDDLIDATGDYNGYFKKMVDSGNWSEHGRMHHRNFLNAKESMKNGITPVIIDNTNIKAKEPKKYVEAALKMGFDENNIRIVDVGDGGVSAEELAKRNTHNVPLKTIQRMMASHKGVGPLNVGKILQSEGGLKNTEKILYSAVVLDDKSKNELIKHFGPTNTWKGWKIFCHHMTIVFGKGIEDKNELGKEVELTVTELGASDMAIAVKVDGYPTTNTIPHITVAVNVAEGGKPFMSNKITNWESVDLGYPLKLYGTVTDIKA